MRTTWLTTLAVTATLVLTACGSEKSGVDSDHHNDADETYVQIAMDQLSTLIALAHRVEEQTDHPELNALAEDMTDALAGPREQMDDLQEEWDIPLVVYDRSAASAPVALTSITLPQMEPDPEWEELRTLEGDEFDALWSQLTLETLESTLASAETVLAEGRNRGLAQTAETLVDLTQAWIDQIEAIGEDLPAN